MVGLKWIGGVGIAAMLGLAAVTAGCSDDDTVATPAGDGGSRTDASGNDGSVTPDAGDAAPGNDGGTQDASDASDASDGGRDVQVEAEAGVVITATVANSAWIQIADDVIFAAFYEDNTILRASDAPHCFALLRSSSKPLSPGGDITVGGDAVGTDGGPPAAVKVTQPANNDYVNFMDPGQTVFPGPGTSARVQVETSGTDAFPALPVTTLRSSPLGTIQVTAPTLADGSANIVVKSDRPLDIRWALPDGGLPDAGAAEPKISTSLWFLWKGARVGELHCGAPVSAGQTTLPASLLGELKRRISAATPIDGASLRIYHGDHREVRVGDNVYFLQLFRTVESTSFGEIAATLD